MPAARNGSASRTLAAMALAAIGLLGLTNAAAAAGAGSIDHVETGDAGVHILYSIPGLQAGQTPDLGSVSVSVDGTPMDAKAEIAASAGDEEAVKRTAILAIDASRSMRGEKFEQAKLAAQAFLAGVSDDVSVGIVAFAGDVTTLQQPSTDRAASLAVLDQLELTLETRLYDGVVQAIESAGQEGQRSILVLSDGRDTSKTELEAVTAAIADSGVKVDVVALAQAEAGLTPLREIAEAGAGAVLSADDPDALVGVFTSQAAALAQQVLVTAALPKDFTATEGTLSVAVDAAGETFTDSAFVPLAAEGAVVDSAPTPRAAAGPTWAIPQPLMLVGLAAAAGGLVLILLMALGVVGGGKPETVEDRIAAYARAGQRGAAHRAAMAPTGSTSLKESALGAAEKALGVNTNFAAGVGAKLEAAGMSLKASEWVLMHAGIALGSAFAGLILSGIFGAVLFLLFGLIGPWLFLGFKRSRRVNAFNSQLADTLQLISGGLSAGLSLAQSVDTVVRQGSEPMVAEFKRALAEARLGVSIEDALESIADRMQSRDFKWVVIAVRIQREVGGNLAEVLTQVAATIRERAYLKRQVKSLSAEGKMSAWILGGLPIVVFLFLNFTNPTYFAPMYGSIFGWIMLSAAIALLCMAAFWMSRLIRMEV